MKVMQENERLKDYVRKNKDDHKKYMAQKEELVQALYAKVKKYKQQYEEKVQEYQAKIKYLQGKMQQNDSVGEDLDRQLEELAKLEGQDQEQDDG